MKKLTPILLVIISSLFFLTSCSLVNPYTKTLEEIRNQNIEGVFMAYEKAFQGIHIDYIKNTTKQYQKDKEKDLLISAYVIISKKNPDEVKNMPLFSVSDIQELNQIYQERTENRIKEINNSFNEFNKIVGSAKTTIRTIDNKIEELQKQRERAVRQAIAAGTITAAGIATVGAVTIP